MGKEFIDPKKAAAGLGGITSSQLIKRNAKTCTDEVESSEEIIIHIGSNDISKGIPSKTVINDIARIFIKGTQMQTLPYHQHYIRGITHL